MVTRVSATVLLAVLWISAAGAGAQPEVFESLEAQRDGWVIETDYMGHALSDDLEDWDWFGTISFTLDGGGNGRLLWASEGVVVTDHVTGAVVEPLYGTGHMDADTLALAKADWLALDRSTASCSQYTGLRARTSALHRRDQRLSV